MELFTGVFAGIQTYKGSASVEETLFSTMIACELFNGTKLIFSSQTLIIGDTELFLKRTPTSDRLLADSELRYPYEGSKTLMHVFDRFEDTALVLKLLDGMYAELPEKNPVKAKRERQTSTARNCFIFLLFK